MDEPARKRRKTSSPAPTSPLRKPARRPSFASPTKASLARNYPDLLASRTISADSPSRLSSRGDILARGRQARAFVMGDTDAHEEPSQNPAQDQDQDTHDTTAGAQQPPSQAQNTTPRARKVAGHKSAPIPLGAVDEAEPDLPATPSQRGLEEQDGPRRGVLFSSPSKRPPRVKDLVKQSPLRPKAPPVRQASATQHLEDGPRHEDDAQKPAEKRQPPDPEVERRKQDKATLQRELEKLKAQVTRCAEEIVKEQQRDAVHSLQPAERSDLCEFIAIVNGSDNKAWKSTPISSLLSSFLPFSSMAIPQPRPEEPEKRVPSHRPVELADPLSYLDMFTSFKVSTQLSLPRGKVFQASNQVHQKHTIDIVGPQKLLAVQISVIIDTLANEAIDMHMLRLSPWAERELGTLLRRKGKEKDLGNACWAIDSYWQIARKRAQHWRRCETTFSHLLTGRASEDTENARHLAEETKTVSRKDLNRHLGRDTLILQDKFVLLKLNWRIGFDWTGEAESEVTVETAFPSVWTEADTGNTFRKVPETFASLSHSKGVFQATKVMVALLFPR